MTSRLLWTVLITSFAAQSRRPRLVATLRLLAAFAATSALGLTLARGLSRSGLPTNLPQAWLAALVASCGFVLFGLILLSIGSARSRTDALTRLLSTLPLPGMTRRVLSSLPSAVILAVTMAFATPVISVLSLPFAPAIWLAGATSALVVILAPRPTPLLKALLFAFLSATSLWLLRQNQPSAVTLILIAPYLLLALRGHQFPASHLHGRLIHLPKPWLPRWWFILKLARNRRSQLALGFALLLSTTTAAAIAWHKLGVLSGSGWLILSAALTAAIACDIRGLTRRYKAPEIEALGGLRYFVSSQTRAALLVAILPALPLLAVLLTTEPALQLLTYCLTIQTAALALGLLAGCIFVPRDGDTGAQFLAAALATSALLGLPKLIHFSPDNPAAWLIVTLLALVLMPMIENFRRHRYATL